MGDDQRLETERLLYQEATRVASLFWEYRYRMMTVFFSGMAILIALAGWLYDRDLRTFVAAPIFLGGLLALVLALLERRNRDILKDAYLVAEQIEGAWRAGGGIFRRINAAHRPDATRRETTFSGVFFLGYVVACVALLALALITLVLSLIL